MKTYRILIHIGLLLGLLFSVGLPQRADAQPGAGVSYQTFYYELAPYGDWVPTPNYGTVWVPNAGPDFQPYATAGRWVVTEYGNTWASDYPWGWAPFHYGRWYYDDYYGWAWVPGYDWAPAWVSWRSGNGYYGWAPLGPGLNYGVNINIPAPYWTFVPQVYITSPRLYSYCVPRPNVVNIYQNTTIINNVYRSNNAVYAYGPPRAEIERVTRQPITVYRADQFGRGGRGFAGTDLGRQDRFDNGFSRGNGRFDNPGNGATYGPSYGGRGRFDRPGNVSEPASGSTPNPTPAPGYGRGSGGFPGDRRFDGGNPAGGNAGSFGPPAGSPGRFEPGRGRFTPNADAAPAAPGNPQPGSSPSFGRPADRFDRMPAPNNAPASGGRSDGGFGRPENRGGFGQTSPQTNPQPAPGNRDERPGAFGGGGRGPR